MIDDNRLAVVIPAHRVADQIQDVISRMPPCVDTIYVVDDASPDDVVERVRALKRANLHILRHERNQGVGGATVTGMLAAREAGHHIVIKCDGDGQMDPAKIPQLVQPLLDGTADHVKGCRFHHFDALGQMPKARLIGNIGLTFAIKLTSGYWHILDPVNGFFATRGDVLDRLKLSAVSRRYFFETDLLIRLNIIEARVAEVRFPAFYANERSSLSVAHALFAFPPRLVRGLLRRVFWRYLFYDVSPIGVFGLLGGLLCGFGVTFGAYEWMTHAIHGTATPAGTVLLATVPCIAGFQLLLQAIVLDIYNSPRPSSRAGEAVSEKGKNDKRSH